VVVRGPADYGHVSDINAVSVETFLRSPADRGEVWEQSLPVYESYSYADILGIDPSRRAEDSHPTQPTTAEGVTALEERVKAQKEQARATRELLRAGIPVQTANESPVAV
jgi:hypothetical protein